MILSTEDKTVLSLALRLLDEYHDAREKTCREFKHICHEHLPQVGEGYVANLNVFDIQDKTVKDIQEAKLRDRETILRLINGK